MKQRNALGRHSENIAVSFLKKSGFKIIERNFRCRFGEIDIIATYRDEIIFVEVRSANTPAFCDPLESISPVKVKRLQKLARVWLYKNDIDNVSVRFDVISIIHENHTQEQNGWGCIFRNNIRLQHIKSAF